MRVVMQPDLSSYAYQLAQHRQDLKDAIATAIEAEATVFKKTLEVQMEMLILAPLRVVTGASNAAFRGVIIIDGLDECDVEKIHDDATNASRTQPKRTKEEDQLEILKVLRQASSDRTCPEESLNI